MTYRSLTYWVSQKPIQLETENARSTVDLGIKEIITTNYDYTLQKSRGVIEKKIRNKGHIKEKVYSLYQTLWLPRRLLADR